MGCCSRLNSLDGSSWLLTNARLVLHFKVCKITELPVSLALVILTGVYPDILHIFDLQIIPDAVVSTLFELSEKVRNRDSFLLTLQHRYERWCNDTGFKAAKQFGVLWCSEFWVTMVCWS